MALHRAQAPIAAINYKTEDFVARSQGFLPTGSAQMQFSIWVGGRPCRERILMPPARRRGALFRSGSWQPSQAKVDFRKADDEASAFITGSTLRARSGLPDKANAGPVRSRGQSPAAFLRDGRFKTVVDRTFPLKNAWPRRIAGMEAGQHIGKIVLTI